jgi:hypothetical protein
MVPIRCSSSVTELAHQVAGSVRDHMNGTRLAQRRLGRPQVGDTIDEEVSCDA